jgi:hypothetical protein
LTFDGIARTVATPDATVLYEIQCSGTYGISMEHPMADLVTQRIAPESPAVRLQFLEMPLVEYNYLVARIKESQDAGSVAIIDLLPHEAETQQIDELLAVEGEIEMVGPP